LQVFYEGAMVQRKTRTETIALQWDAKHQGSTCPIARHLDVDNGWKVREARIVPSKKDELRNVKLDIVPDKTRVKLTAEIVKPKTGLVGKALAAPQCVVHVELTLERRGQIVNRPGDVVAFQANVPGMTTMPLPPPPPGMEVKGRRIALELKDGNQTLWGPGMPKGAQLSFKNRALRVSASDLGNELRIDVLEARPN
jgi:hypothetical protein